METPLSCIACHTRGGAVNLHMKGFKVPCVFFISSFRYHVIPKRFAFSFDTKRTFLFRMTGDRNSHAIPFFSLVLFFLAESSGMSEVIAFVGDHASLSEASVSYDRQCKIKRCPQNGLTAYTIVIYVWPSERFCGQSVHGNFRGEACLSVIFDVNQE